MLGYSIHLLYTSIMYFFYAYCGTEEDKQFAINSNGFVLLQSDKVCSFNSR